MRVPTKRTVTGSGLSPASELPTPKIAKGAAAPAADALELGTAPKRTLNLSGGAAATEPSVFRTGGKMPQYQPLNGTLFDSNIAPEAIEQGALGDCYFLSSLASLAQRNPNAIQNLVQDNGNGTYTVTLFEKVKGSKDQFRPVREVVDNRVPKLADAKGNEKPAFVTDRDPKELWPELVEKAFAQHLKGYSQLNQGGFEPDAMEALTGKPATTTNLNPKKADQIYERLETAISQGQLTTAGTYSNADLRTNLEKLKHEGIGTFEPSETHYSKLGLVDGHAYTVLGVSDENGVKSVQLRNPWGEQGYQGQGKKTGEFSMPLSDFVQLYQEVSIGG
jgi:hypothetical protein